MKKSNIILSWLVGFSVCLSGCHPTTTHTHEFLCEAVEEKYLKVAATCEVAAEYYYTCECGEVGSQSFYYGEKLEHDYTAKVEEDKYVKTKKNCLHGTEYFYSCAYCGVAGTQTFMVEGLGEHMFNQKVHDFAYIKEEATFTSCPEYYKSCICGLAGEDSFFYGETLKEYTDEEKIPYTPTSLTVTLFDTQESLYGLTYNTTSQPLRPVIQVAEGDSFENYIEYTATFEKATSYTDADEVFTYYIVKAEIPLKDKQRYTYRAYDKYVGVGSEITTLQTKDLSATEFCFSHISDSQSSKGVGTGLGKVLSHIDTDFIIHTGDVVENSKVESEWTAMLDGNFNYLSKIPMMAISGNHETTYKNGSNETYKHFNNKMVEQDTKLGYYYSFVYGNAKFIMLNTNKLTGDKLTETQYNWLVDELSNSTETWKIVALHNPLYSAGTYGSDPERNSISVGLRSQLTGVFYQHGVDIVLQGHDHLVSRTHAIDGNGNPVDETWETINGIQYSKRPKGVVYLMNGPAGEQARNLNAHMDNLYYNYAKNSNANSWADFSIKGNSLTITVNYVNENNVVEYCSWGIDKN